MQDETSNYFVLVFEEQIKIFQSTPKVRLLTGTERGSKILIILKKRGLLKKLELKLDFNAHIKFCSAVLVRKYQ